MTRKTAASTRLKNVRNASAPAGDTTRVPAPGEGKRGEQGYLGYLLRQAHAAVRLTMERTLADLGVTSPQFAVMTMLNAYPGLSGADVARLTFLTPQTVGVIIRNLERDGAIVMSPHPVHGRILQWTLTPRGATLLNACRQRVLELEKRLARDLDSKAETTIRRWLAGIAKDLQRD
ncbi:MarR family winged helix-turn-helix transcriptional regulator [Bradyrhizobium liaoningense]